MITKQITVKRVYNLGNYENRSVERTVELNEGENADEIQHELVEKVERDVKTSWFENLESELEAKRNKLAELHEEIDKARVERHKLQNQILTNRTYAKTFLLNLFSKEEIAELCGLNNSEKGDYELAEIVEEE